MDSAKWKSIAVSIDIYSSGKLFAPGLGFSVSGVPWVSGPGFSVSGCSLWAWVLFALFALVPLLLAAFVRLFIVLCFRSA